MRKKKFVSNEKLKNLKKSLGVPFSSNKRRQINGKIAACHLKENESKNRQRKNRKMSVQNFL